MCESELSALVRSASMALRPSSTGARLSALDRRFDGLRCFFGRGLHLGVGFLRLRGALFGELAEAVGKLGRVEREGKCVFGLPGSHFMRSLVWPSSEAPF
jgi:hypothetical protein